MVTDPGIVEKEDCVLLVVDIQEAFRPVLQDFDLMVKNISKLIRACALLSIPVASTEQYPKGLGRIVKELQPLLTGKNFEKVHFSCFGDSVFEKELVKYNKKDIIVAGNEAHICVLKTVLDGIVKGYRMHVVVDAIASQRKLDKEVSVERMKQSGAFLTTAESIIFQLIDSSEEREFKQISKIVKGIN